MRCESCGHDNPPEARFCVNCGSSLLATIKPPAPAVVPNAEPAAPEAVIEYKGFWRRFAAVIIDSLVLLVGVVFVWLWLALGSENTLVVILGTIVVPLLYYWLLTGFLGQTIGKMAVNVKVVNATGSVPGLGRAALREIPGKILSTIAIFLGFLWVAWDKRKQGWHDKIAGTYVVSKGVKTAAKTKRPPDSTNLGKSRQGRW